MAAGVEATRCIALPPLLPAFAAPATRRRYTAACRPPYFSLQTYAQEQNGCGYGALPPSEWPFGGIAAVDPLALPFAVGVQQGCGVCLEVQCTDPTACGTSQSLLVLVADHCDGCGAEAVYLAPSAFGQLVPGPLGSVAGRFRRVRGAVRCSGCRGVRLIQMWCRL